MAVECVSGVLAALVRVPCPGVDVLGCRLLTVLALRRSVLYRRCLCHCDVYWSDRECENDEQYDQCPDVSHPSSEEATSYTGINMPEKELSGPVVDIQEIARKA